MASRLCSEQSSLHASPCPRPVVTDESWLTLLDAADDTDEFLDRLLQDGTAKAMREQEIESARGEKLHASPLDSNPISSAEAPLTSGRHSIATTDFPDRTAPGRPTNIFTDFAVQDMLAAYRIRTSSTPIELSEPISPTS